MIRYKIVAAKNRMGSIVKFSSGKLRHHLARRHLPLRIERPDKASHLHRIDRSSIDVTHMYFFFGLS